MSDQFSMFLPEILPASRNATSSQGLADGPSHCASQAGLMTDQSGPDHPHASLSAPPESNSVKATRDTSPPILSAWSGQPAPLCCLASKSQARLSSEVLQNRLNEDLALRLNGLGSMIYQTDLKLHDTPLGRRIFRLRASARRISVKEPSSERSGWPTPNASNIKNAYQDAAKVMARKDAGRQSNLQDFACLTGWPTPSAQMDSGNSGTAWEARRERVKEKLGNGNGFGLILPMAAQLTGWPTPATRDYKGESGAGRQERKGDPADTVPNAAALAGWPTPQAGAAAMNGNNAAGNTDFSRKTEALAGKDIAGHNCNLLQEWNGPARRTALGQMLTGCSAEMESGGQLNPAHSRWLMGYPPEWDDCAVMAMQSSPKRRRNSSKPS